MFARQHNRPTKHLFHVDRAQNPQRRRIRIRIVATRRHRKKRFYVEPSAPSYRPAMPFQLVIERRHPRRRSASVKTLAQRRHMRRWALFLTVACVLLTGVAGVLYFGPLAPARTQRASLAVSGAAHVGHEGALQNLATRPFAALQPHVAANSLQPPAVQAKAAFLFDPDRGWIFYQKNADEERSIASLTKMMTLLVAFDTGNLDQLVTIGPDAAALVNSNNSYMGVSAGEQIPLRDLLYGLVLASGNDAAVAIADGVGGTEASFVALMNGRARWLGLTHSFYVTPDGLDDGNHSTARDLAVLAAIAMERPGVEQLTSSRRGTIPQTATHKTFNLLNSNDLLPGGSSPYPGANGIKTGYTQSAMYCMAFSARRQGHLIVGVVLGDPSPQARLSDAHTLLDWGFAQE